MRTVRTATLAVLASTAVLAFPTASQAAAGITVGYSTQCVLGAAVPSEVVTLTATNGARVPYSYTATVDGQAYSKFIGPGQTDKHTFTPITDATFTIRITTPDGTTVKVLTNSCKAGPTEPTGTPTPTPSGSPAPVPGGGGGQSGDITPSGGTGGGGTGGHSGKGPHAGGGYAALQSGDTAPDSPAGTDSENGPVTGLAAGAGALLLAAGGTLALRRGLRRR
ncbi:hypothetical protein [Kitasatospora sp. NPDC002040]|uniref:hypothetical protein n=1 Tax=Kitasatospora sp. NPDC002040 TaxID=3154661 RepID=UPI00331AAD0D